MASRARLPGSPLGNNPGSPGRLASMLTEPAISTEPRGILTFPRVVIEADGSALASLIIRSHVSVPLTVHLSSSSPEAVTFQLENENLRQQAEDDDPDDWNHLFNEIGHIDAITLPAHGEQTIFLSFRPQLRGDGANEKNDDSHAELKRQYGEVASFRERHAIEEARASIRLVPTWDAPPPTMLLPIDASTAAAASSSSSSSEPPPLPQPPPLDVELRARHCLSVLRVDAHELAFEAVTIGGSAVKDFTVWNCSEVPLRFRLALTHRGASVPYHERPEIDFQDADNGVPLSGGAGQHVLGYSHTRVRAYLTAKEVGQFSMQLGVINLGDARNTELLRVHVLVTTTVQEEGLRLSGDGTAEQGTLDFGNCYAHLPTRSLITVRNTSASALDVHFSSDEPGEVSFDLAVAADDPNEKGNDDRGDGEVRAAHASAASAQHSTALPSHHPQPPRYSHRPLPPCLPPFLPAHTVR